MSNEIVDLCIIMYSKKKKVLSYYVFDNIRNKI